MRQHHTRRGGEERGERTKREKGGGGGGGGDEGPLSEEGRMECSHTYRNHKSLGKQPNLHIHTPVHTYTRTSIHPDSHTRLVK